MALSDKIYRTAVKNNQKGAKNRALAGAIGQIGPAILSMAYAYRQRKDQEARDALEQQRFDAQQALTRERMQMDEDQHRALLSLRGDEMAQAATLADRANTTSLARERIQQEGMTGRDAADAAAKRAEWRRAYNAGFDLNTSRGMSDMEAGSLAALMASGIKPGDAQTADPMYEVMVGENDPLRIGGLSPGKHRITKDLLRESMSQASMDRRAQGAIDSRVALKAEEAALKRELELADNDLLRTRLQNDILGIQAKLVEAELRAKAGMTEAGVSAMSMDPFTARQQLDTDLGPLGEMMQKLRLQELLGGSGRDPVAAPVTTPQAQAEQIQVGTIAEDEGGRRHRWDGSQWVPVP